MLSHPQENDCVIIEGDLVGWVRLCRLSVVRHSFLHVSLYATRTPEQGAGQT